ncbi:MAG TPA: YceI family protein, partial [Chthoniobacterales bacterium]
LACAARADTFVIDKAHSSVGFQVRHLFSKVPGKFTDFSGRITLDEAAPEKSGVEVSIKTASVDTSNQARDKDLRSDEFFAVEKFPEITFKSESVKSTGQNTADVTGKLTMHGVTRDVVLKAELLGKGPGMQGKIVSGWDATTTLKRTDFGLNWNKVIEGTQVVGEDVQVELHIEADKGP